MIYNIEKTFEINFVEFTKKGIKYARNIMNFAIYVILY